jgi:hypothetical protein
LAKCRARMGFNTNSASSAARTLKLIATMNTASQPRDFTRMEAKGTNRVPAPLAVYSMPLLAAANLEPKVSPWVAGNKLYIEPYMLIYSGVTST